MAESSLTGFILKQAFKSRDEAKAKKASQDKAVASGKKVDDKDRKGLFRKAFTKNLFGGLFGGKSATGGGSSTATGALLGGGKPKKKQPKGGGGKPSGGKAKGLEKILLTGFGSLVADTTAISGGLAALTEIMNSQLNIEGDMSSNLQGINAILADQLEVQTSFLDAIGVGGKPAAGGGETSSLFGGVAAKQTDSGSLITSLVDQVKNNAAWFGGGAGFASLFNPVTAFLGGGLAMGGLQVFGAQKTKESVAQMYGPEKIQQSKKEFESAQKEYQKNKTPENFNKLQEKLKWYNEYSGNRALQSGLMTNPSAPDGFSSGGIVKYSEGIINQTNKIFNNQQSVASKMSSGGSMIANFVSLSGGGMVPSAIPQSSTAYPMAAGGTNAMIGEAGKEAVVPLHSADSPAKSKIGMDPSMQASAGSMLAVTDQFIKSMGPLGGPVSQALGADISNLAKTFGMSQTLPNLSLGGGKFREDTTAKKGREKFLKELIAGSLESLGAKSKTEGAAPASPNPIVTTPPPPGTNNPVSNPAPNNPSSNSEKPMDGKYADPKSQGGAAIPDLTSGEATTQGLDKKEVKQRYLPFPAKSADGSPNKWHDKYHILLNTANGSYEVWEKPGVFNWAPKQVFLGKKENKGAIQNSAIGKEAHNEVRNFMRVHMPDTAKNVFKWVSDTDINNANAARANGNQEKGGSVKSFQQGGKVVQKPWWDFLGWVTASQEVKKGTTGIYSDSPMGRISEAAAQRNKMMKELGYESGGTLTGIKSAPAPKVAPVSYTPMATADTESTDIGAIVNIVGSQAQQPIPVMPNNEGQTTSDYVGAPMGGGLAFTVLSTSQWGG